MFLDFNMTRIRNDQWKHDPQLQHDLEEDVKRSYKRNAVLTCVKKKYPQFAWSLRTLATGLKYFGIIYKDYHVDMANVYHAVFSELEGAGSRIGYRAMRQKNKRSA